jgi:hypothetical protein
MVKTTNEEEISGTGGELFVDLDGMHGLIPSNPSLSCYTTIHEHVTRHYYYELALPLDFDGWDMDTTTSTGVESVEVAAEG